MANRRCFTNTTLFLLRMACPSKKSQNAKLLHPTGSTKFAPVMKSGSVSGSDSN